MPSNKQLTPQQKKTNSTKHVATPSSSASSQATKKQKIATKHPPKPPPAPAMINRKNNPLPTKPLGLKNPRDASKCKDFSDIRKIVTKSDFQGTYAAWMIAAGREVQAIDPASGPNAKKAILVIDIEQKQIVLRSTATGNPEKDIMKLQEFTKFLDALEILTFDDHLDARSAEAYKNLYQIEPREFLHDTASGDASPSLESVACRDCGIYLPLDRIQIDHTRPQKDKKYNEDKDGLEKVTDLTTLPNPHLKEAVAKALRAFNMTEEGPFGSKNQAIRTMYTQTNKIKPKKLSRVPYGAHNAQPVQAPLTPQAMKAAQKAQKARYTLNFRGTLVYSIFKAAGCRDLLERRCLNSITNLRPMCSLCNTKKSNAALRYNPNWGPEYRKKVSAPAQRMVYNEHALEATKALAMMTVQIMLDKAAKFKKMPLTEKEKKDMKEEFPKIQANIRRAIEDSKKKSKNLAKVVNAK